MIKLYLLKSLPYLIGAGIAIGCIAYIYDAGHSNGYADGLADTKDQIEDVKEQANEMLETRDQEWELAVQEYIVRISRVEEQRQVDLAREGELRTRLRSLTTRLLEAQTNVQTADIGVCNLTTGFDRLLDNAYSAAGGTPTSREN